jgi:hypothetical protein
VLETAGGDNAGSDQDFLEARRGTSRNSRFIGKNRLVYLLIADKRLKYKDGKSRIAYIGTTEKGVERIAQSVAFRADAILRLRGVRSFHARIVTCGPRQCVETWKKLERALILRFRERFGAVPKCNSHGKKSREPMNFVTLPKQR